MRECPAGDYLASSVRTFPLLESPMLKYIPFMAVLLVLYNIVAFSSGASIHDELDAALFSIPLPSGVALSVSVGSLLLLLGAVVLYIELSRAVRQSRQAALDHALSLLVFVVFLIELLVFEGAGTSTFLILTVMSLLDVIAGFTVSLAAARRDFTVGSA